MTALARVSSRLRSCRLSWEGDFLFQAEEEGKELGSGYGQDALALQTAEYRDFHLQSSTQALLFSSIFPVSGKLPKNKKSHVQVQNYLVSFSSHGAFIDMGVTSQK